MPPGTRIVGAAAVATGTPRAWKFDGFEFDLQRGELRRTDRTPIPLRPKAEVLLRHLLEAPGRLFSRDELISIAWPASVVTDDSLVQCMVELRTALDDRAQRLIRTVPRRGYRFEAAVSPVFEPAPALCDELPVEAHSWAPPAPRGDPADLREPGGAAPSATAGPATPPSNPLRRRGSSGSPSIRAVVLGCMGAAVLLASGAVALWHAAEAPVHIDDEIAARTTVAIMP
ncbi:MAG: transcriptional regulator, partial [Caldimonas sp.]